jgi:hypothetical protein
MQLSKVQVSTFGHTYLISFILVFSLFSSSFGSLLMKCKQLMSNLKGYLGMKCNVSQTFFDLPKTYIESCNLFFYWLLSLVYAHRRK